MVKVLVTGASGYIGSHTVIDLINNGFEVIGIDNQSNSSLKAYDRIEEITGQKPVTYDIDIKDKSALKNLFHMQSDIQCIIHFAAFKSVDESVSYPVLYYENNVSGMINLLACQVEYNIPNHIFSSSCTVYGNTADLPVTEDTPWQVAESPYGLTKQIGESMLGQLTSLTPGLKSISLRYFNPAGAHPSGRLGEAAIKEVRNLVPLIMEVGVGKRPLLNVYGDDYPTRDGTNIRDYIHIMDLANAHTLALKYLLDSDKHGQTMEVFNLGTGQGVSILEAINSFEKVTGQSLNYKITDRRPGDVIAIYADFQRALTKLEWKPKYTLDDIMTHAWLWEQNKSAFLS